MGGERGGPLERLISDRDGPTPLRNEFRWQLASLEMRLIESAESVTDLVVPTTAAFLDGEPEDEDRVRVVAEVTSACRGLENDGYVLIARQSPVAADLRRVVTVVRGAGDVHRSASLLRHIAASVRWMDPAIVPPPLRSVVWDLAGVVTELGASAVAAWRARDGLAAVDLQKMDDRADELQLRLHAGLREHACGVDEAVGLALVARYLERIGDHAVELARGVTYAVTGERLPEE